MPDDSVPRRWKPQPLVVVLALLVAYVLGAPLMIFWHDRGMPDALQTVVTWVYGPLHWLIVVTTGYGNG